MTERERERSNVTATRKSGRKEQICIPSARSEPASQQPDRLNNHRLEEEEEEGKGELDHDEVSEQQMMPRNARLTASRRRRVNIMRARRPTLQGLAKITMQEVHDFPCERGRSTMTKQDQLAMTVTVAS